MEMTAGAPGPASDAGDDVRVPWTPRDVLIAVVLFVITPYAVTIPLIWIPFLFGDDESTGFLAAAIILSIPVYLAIVVLAWWFSIRKYGAGLDAFGIKAPTWGTFGWAAAAVFGAFVVAGIYGGIVEGFDLTWLQQECDDQVPLEIRESALLLALSSVVAVVFAPTTEEFFFRGFAFRGLLRWGVIPAALISGLVFGSAHLVSNPMLYKSLVPLSAIGVVFALAFFRSGNLLTSVAAHFTYNLIGVILLASTTCEPS